MTVVPIVFFCAIELVLSLSGYGYDPSFFIKNRFSNQDVYTDNKDFGSTYFPPALLRWAGPKIFPAKKPAGTYRIFVLGESAAEGVPDSAYSFARILEVLLVERFPKQRFEIINTGTTAINSNVILPIARDCARLEPDLFIIYMGNNEVIGPYGPGTVFTSYSSNLKAVRASIWLKSTKTGQLLNSLHESLASQRGKPKEWGSLAMFLQHQLRADDPRMNAVYDNYRQNLRDICSAAQAANAEVIISTVGVNLRDSAPFVSLHKMGLTASLKKKWDGFYLKGVQAEKLGEYRKAINFLNKAAAIDDSFADLQFRLGRCYLSIQSNEESYAHFKKSRDYDALRLRADSNINAIIRSVADDTALTGLHLVDNEQAIRKVSSQGIPGDNLFYEHVHMNFSGNYQVALNLFKEIEKILPPAISKNIISEKVLSQAECEKRLAYTPWNDILMSRLQISIMRSPPFTNQLDHSDKMYRWEQSLKRKEKVFAIQGMNPSINLYQQALKLREQDWMLHMNYGRILLQARKGNEAIREFQTLQQLLPNSSWGFQFMEQAKQLRNFGIKQSPRSKLQFKEVDRSRGSRLSRNH